MNVETILAAAIALISAVGGATAFFRQSLGNNVIKLQASEIATLTGKNSRLEKDNAALVSENRVLRKYNDRLTDKIQGSAQLKALTDAIEAQAKVVDNLTRTIDSKLSEGMR